MGFRTRSARTRPVRRMLAGMLAIPLVSLVALWGFAASVTLGQSIQDGNYNSEYTIVGRPAQALGLQLAQERLQSFAWLSAGRKTSRRPMDAERDRTDAAVAALRRGAAAARNVTFPAAKPSLARFIAQLGQLNRIRAGIDAGTMGALRSFRAYDNIVDTEYRFYDAAVAVPDVALYRQSAASVQAGYALELAGREAALAGGALAAGGRMSRAERELFTQAVATQRYAMSSALAQLNPALRAPYAKVYSSPAHATFKAMEDRISASSGTIPVTPRAWQAVTQAFLKPFIAATRTEAAALTERGSQLAHRLQFRLALAGGVGLIAVALSAFLVLRFGRRLTRELTRLHEAARNLADNRLPWVAGRLRRGEDVDVAAEAPPLTPGRTAEIAKITQAFSTVQRTAVDAAVGQANLRRDVSQVFVNLARRNQSLLDRQLDILGSMERATAGPGARAGFFRLDHLTMRMRRHAESLIILSGHVPGRGWRQPVPVVDVLRGAVAEIEDYVRVEVISQARDMVVGSAVADVIHLVAELLENATSFSPSNTRVTVAADKVGNGFAVEIEDRGLGLGSAEMAGINRRLADPPEFDLADSDRLGLFVVGQLAARHRIRVSLRESPFGGTTAIVLMPHTIVVPEDKPGTQAEPAHDGAAAPWSPRRDPDAPGNGGKPAGTAPGSTAPASHGAGGTDGHKMAESASDGQVPEQAGVPARTAAADTGEETYPGLPRRIRQANLAPQLRAGTPSPAGTDHSTATPADAVPQPLSPEEARSRLVSMQQGWQRGREDEPGRSEPTDPRTYDPASVTDTCGEPGTEDEQR